MKLKVLDLFSGIGGFSLGLERTGGFETVAFCEFDENPRKVLKKHWPEIPIYEDVRTLEYDGNVDVICGGYPCQPFSSAGKRQGENDDRHLWPAMFDLVKKHRPSWVIGENVAGHISMGLDNVLNDLGRENYTTRAFVIPACSVNAPHRRDRLWIIANSKSINGNVYENGISQEKLKQGFWGDKLRGYNLQEIDRAGSGFGGAKIEPTICGVDDGFSYGVDRLKQLGNSVVPQLVEIIGEAILQSLNVRKD